MAIRCVLHKTKIDEFKQWLSEVGIEFRPGKGCYQVLQVMVNGNFTPVYDSAKHSREHYSVQDELMPTVRHFLRDGKKKRDAK